MSAKQTLRICTLGDGGVGKTALTIQLCSNHFVEFYDPTIEDSYRKQAVIDGECVNLEILDTAGQEEYSSLRDQWIRTCEGFIVVFDLTSRSSFNQLPSFKESIVRAKDTDVFPLVVVGNKLDLAAEKRQVATDEGKELAKSFGVHCRYIEASAFTRHNVEESYYTLVREIRNYYGQVEENKKTKKGKKKSLAARKDCSIL